MKLKFFSAIMMIVICISIPPSSFSVSGESVDVWDGVAFFGDSTTHGLIRYIVKVDSTLYSSITRDQILTPPDGTFYLPNLPKTYILYQGKRRTLSEAINRSSPRILIVTVGVNGLSRWNKDEFVQLYNRLLDILVSASPDTKIILQSIFPTAKIRSKRLAGFTVERVDMVNEWISEIAQARNLLYVNSADALKGEDGWLRSEYHNGDGLHLNTDGFKCVLSTIQKVLEEQKGNQE